MMTHTFSEGLILLRTRFLVSLGLSGALAVPLALGAIIGATMLWLRPLVASAPETIVVPVLLHPQMDDAQRAAWLEEVRRAHPAWRVREVPTDELSRRMAAWFPYLENFLRREGGRMLPPLVEVETAEAASVEVLLDSPRVIAIGPRSSLLEVLGGTARTLAVWLGVCALALLAAAGLLAAVWVHLELFRHADEITIMRLVGATESTVQGPFLVAVTAPGLLGGLLAGAGMVATCKALSQLTTGLGLPPVSAPWWLGLLCVACGLALPLLAALWTLGRHSQPSLET